MKQLKEILDIVSELTEIPSNLIASQDKKEAVVFAKKLFVVATKKLGFPTSAISKTLNITPQAVRMLNNTKDLRKIFSEYTKEIEKKINNQERQKQDISR
jgi:heterodisulfide reductase subunit B